MEKDATIIDTFRKKKIPIHHTLGFRIMVLFLVITVIVSTGFLIFYAGSLYNYYYDNVAGALLTQARYNADLYLTYLSDDNLMNVVVQNKNNFYRSNRSQVQILTNSGIVLYDSTASAETGTVLETPDVKDAQENEPGIHMGHSQNDEGIMSVSYPLSNQSKQIGILRLTTSLKPVHAMVLQRMVIALIFGIGAIAVSILLSYLVSRSIINPINSLTRVAKKLADGQFSVRCNEQLKGEIGELGRVLNFMSDNIEKNNILKNDFISSVSHELRTPLTAIKGWAITLQSDGVAKELNNEGLKIIEQESERLSAMVEDLLDFSRFSSGRITLNKTKFNIVSIARRIVSQFQPRIRDQKLDMVFNYSHDDIIITADEDRMKQLLLNILDNAIKFTPENGTVVLDLLQEENRVAITITDTGVGISDDEIDLVTQKFWKGTTSQSHSGLGLSISEEIVRAHGGTLHITSKLGVGTSVKAEFPRESA